MKYLEEYNSYGKLGEIKITFMHLRLVIWPQVDLALCRSLEEEAKHK